MTSRQVDETAELRAEKEIDAFAQRLLGLGGGRVPRAWKHRLLKALKPTPKAPGLKLDTKRYAAIIADLALSSRTDPENEKPTERVERRRLIAKTYGVSLRTVNRIASQYRGLEGLDRLTPDRRKAQLEGMSAAVSENLKRGK